MRQPFVTPQWLLKVKVTTPNNIVIMLSWFQNKDNQEKKQNDLQQSIFEDNEGDIKETPTTKNRNIIPTPDNYPMHAAVLKRDPVELQKHIDNLPSFDPLVPDKMKPINQIDHHGYTALHLCVLTSWNEGVDIMLKNKASPTVRRYYVYPCTHTLTHTYYTYI